MTDHFARSVELMDRAESLRSSIDLAHTERPKNPVKIARLNDRLRFTLTMAKLHANLAEVQAMYDLRAEVTELVCDLTSVPPFIPQPRARALGVVEGSVES